MSHDTSIPNEQWRDIPGYEGRYKVSDRGRIKSVSREIPQRNGSSRLHKGKVLVTPLNGQGRPSVVLRCAKGKARTFMVHWIVLEAFVGPRPKGADACHRDDNRVNNHLSNLYWGSRSENSRDKVINGRDYQSLRTHCPRGHELVSPNLVPHDKKLGRRNCLACNRARSYVRYRKELKPKFQSISDDYYRVIAGKLEKLESSSE